MSSHLDALEKRLSEIDGAREARRLGNALERAGKALDKAESKIGQIEILAAFVPRIRNRLDQEQREELSDGFRKLRQTGRQALDANTSEQLQALAQTLKQTLPPRVELVRKPIQQAWQAQLDRTFGGTAQLGKVLRGIPQMADTGIELSQIARRVEQLRARLDDAEEQWQQFQGEQQARSRCTREIEESGADKQITDFLLATADEKATLADCSPEVLDWLREQDATGLFQVRLTDARSR